MNASKIASVQVDNGCFVLIKRNEQNLLFKQMNCVHRVQDHLL